MKLFGSSGMRSVVDKEFLELAFTVGLAVGSSYSSLLIGNDTRTSGPAMKYAFLSGLLSAGASAYDAGIAPTPTIAYASRGYQAGAIITASHNPPEYNGIKLVNPDGSAFDAAQREHIEKTIGEHSSKVTTWEDMGSYYNLDGIIEEHIKRVLKDFHVKFRLKVAVDCGCGAASKITPHLLNRLGCKTILLNCTPSGYFPRGIEPVQENLSDLIKTVQQEKANLGIAHDGDADRIVIVDDKGALLTGDQLLALIARYITAKKVITTVDASMLIDDMGFDVIRTKVGDAFVSDELRKSANTGQGEFGGEASGCYIFPQVSLCPDAIYSAAVVLQIASEKSLSSLVSELPTYSLLRGGIPGNKELMPLIKAKLIAKFEGNISTIDGLRIAFHDGWLLIRPSGTEPKIRLTAEAKNKRRAKEIYNMGYKIIEECLKEQEGVRK